MQAQGTRLFFSIIQLHTRANSPIPSTRPLTPHPDLSQKKINQFPAPGALHVCGRDLAVPSSPPPLFFLVFVVCVRVCVCTSPFSQPHSPSVVGLGGCHVFVPQIISPCTLRDVFHQPRIAPLFFALFPLIGLFEAFTIISLRHPCCSPDCSWCSPCRRSISPPTPRRASKIQILNSHNSSNPE